MRKKHMNTEAPKFSLQPKSQEANGLDAAKYYEFQKFDYLYEQITTFPVSGVGLERFLPLLPVEGLHVSLGQTGDTPITHATKFGETVGLANLYIKQEEFNPTGCFKDRESIVVVSAAMEKGIDDIYVISSGNAALSTAAYAQKAGIRCTCYVPEKTSEEKKSLIQLFGAKLETIPGFYEDVYRTVVDRNPKGWNVTSGQNPYRLEGGKTIAFELFEQLGKVPDTIVIPSGNGGCLAATWNGFVELKKLGLIDTLPKMVSVQITKADPIAVAFEQHVPFVVLGDIENSIAEGIIAQESYCSPKAVEALTESQGYTVSVTDSEIVEALRTIIHTESIVPEPTSAAVYAALPKLHAAQDELVVAVNTGSGMKLLGEITQILGEGVHHE
jgi:threonine synthase